MNGAVVSDVIRKKLSALFAMLHGMAERGKCISQGCRRYWTGRYEQLLDIGHALEVVNHYEDASWRQAFRTELAMLTDAKAMQRIRRKCQAREAKVQS